MDDEGKELIQKTIDRILYCDKRFKEELNQLLEHYDPHKEKRFNNNPKDWKFPLEESI